MRSLTEYMRKELIFYIKQEYDRGIPLSRIKRSLKEGGHHQNLVKEAMTALKRNDYNLIKALNEPVRSDLDKELYFNIMNSLIKYAEHQLASGRSEKEVKKILSDYGHSEDIIDKAIKGVKEEIPSSVDRMRKIDISFIVGIVILIFFTAAGTLEPLYLVVGGFLPTLLTMSVLNLQAFATKNKNTSWLYAPFFSAIFLILGELGFLAEGYHVFNITMLNLGISLIYTYIKAVRDKDVREYMESIRDSVATESDQEVSRTKEKKESSKRKSKKK